MSLPEIDWQDHDGTVYGVLAGAGAPLGRPCARVDSVLGGHRWRVWAPAPDRETAEGITRRGLDVAKRLAAGALALICEQDAALADGCALCPMPMNEPDDIERGMLANGLAPLGEQEIEHRARYYSHPRAAGINPASFNHGCAVLTARRLAAANLELRQENARLRAQLPPPRSGECDPHNACATHGRCWTHSEWDWSTVLPEGWEWRVHLLNGSSPGRWAAHHVDDPNAVVFSHGEHRVMPEHPEVVDVARWVLERNDRDPPKEPTP